MAVTEARTSRPRVTPEVADLVDTINETSVLDDLSECRGMPQSIYHSRDFYEFEKEAVFARSWLAVGRHDQVANPGDYFTITVADDPLIVVNDDGVVRVMSNVCAHRSHLVADGPGHTDTTLRGPLHYWSYNLSGELVAAPEMSNTVPLAELREISCLPQLKVEMWQGWIFANFDTDAEPLAPTLGKLDKEMEGYHLDEMVIAGSYDFPHLPWNWKLMLENVIEPYHTGFLHKGPHDWAPLRLLGFDESFDAAVDGAIYHPAGTTHADGGFNSLGRSLFPILPDLSEEQRNRVLFGCIPPLYLCGLCSDYVFWIHVLPEDADHILLRVEILVPPTHLQVPNFELLLRSTMEGHQVFVEQDVEAVTKLQQGARSRLAQRGPYSHLERTLIQLNQWLNRRYQDYVGQTAGE
jgi:phenylpropionate dioxygenase-like ring-hydroxylating dioxygenase large terminal subunit